MPSLKDYLFYQDDWTTIYCGDCLEVMPLMDSIDLILTSPPFRDEDVNGDYWELYEKYHNRMLRVSKKVVCVIQSPTRITELAKRFPPHRWMIWAKPWSCYTFRFNPILVYAPDEDYNPNKTIWKDYFTGSPPDLNTKLHRYEDPLSVYKELIKMFKECDVILDPFMGSGTTLVAAKNLNHQSIGIEINPDSCTIAVKRLRQEVFDFRKKD